MIDRSGEMQMIRPATAADAQRIAGIYNLHVRETVVTFEEQPVADDEMARRIAETTFAYPWLVSEIDGSVAGYAYASSWKRRSAYRFAAESTIYMATQFVGRGMGSEKLGFRHIGQFREVGWKFGKWVDVGYWELLL